MARTNLCKTKFLIQSVKILKLFFGARQPTLFINGLR